MLRDHLTGWLRKEFILVVDNWPAEQPSSPMVPMSLARLLKFLNLDKICQTLFAEYHSKRYFVERAHAKENWMLSKHRQFRHKSIRKTDTPGSQQHMENMEHVASEVIQCISQGSFGRSSILRFRGVQQENSVFFNKEKLSLGEAS